MADDLLLVSSSQLGLQNCLNKRSSFYEKLSLKINIKKTAIFIFNKRGLTIANKLEFRLNGQKVRIVDEYQYLGLKLKPSGSMGVAVQELRDKASRAWFGISNTVAKNKEWKLRKYLTFLTHL